jgi:23S rRNA-/tRNA-specific pseudouridylate synthase
MYGNAKKYFITAKKNTPILELLAQNLPSVPNPEIILESGGIWLEKTRLANPAQIINTKQTILVYVCPTQGKIYQLTNNIVFEDKNLFIVNKPAGITSISDRSNIKYNLTYGVKLHFQKLNLNYNPSAINRLDFMVQGLVIYAKNKETEKQLFRIMEQRKIGKIYLATLAHFPNPPKYLRIKDTLGFQRKTFLSKEGKAAHSLFIHRKTLAEGELYSVITFTGRRHQIRFHASKYLAPIIGDEFYGSKIPTPNQVIKLFAHGYNLTLNNKRYKIRHVTP